MCVLLYLFDKFKLNTNKKYFHNGWPTMRRYIFNKIKYNSSYNIGQDSDFNSNVILNGFNTTILNVSLGFYRKDNLCIYFIKSKTLYPNFTTLDIKSRSSVEYKESLNLI